MKNLDKEISELRDRISSIIYLLEKSKEVDDELRRILIMRLTKAFVFLDRYYVSRLEEEIDRGIELAEKVFEETKDSDDKDFPQLIAVIREELENDKKRLGLNKE